MDDQFYLLEALKLADIRRGFCAPNPAVGAIVVKNQTIIGQGYHYQAGLPHAEVNALAALPPNEAAGSTVYVTLEPCCHVGRTPPCTDLLIHSQVARVVYGFTDPNPLVAGQGAYKLQQAGILCDYLPLAELSDFYESYAFWRKYQRPFLTAKLALSADNKAALADRRPATITNKATNQFTHEHRLHTDAILTSIETILQDNPRLNARSPDGIIAKPVFIVDRQLQFSLDCQLMQTASAITLFHAAKVDSLHLSSLQQAGIHCVEVRVDHNQHLDLTVILDFLGKAGYHDVWLEAGPRLFQALTNAKLAQLVYIYQAALKLGNDGYPANLADSFLQHYHLINAMQLAEDEIKVYKY